MPYLGKQSEQVGVSIQKYEFLHATDTSSGTTSFSVPSDSGDHVNVWLNGVLLVEGGSDDYSKSNTAITFNSAPADGDIIRIDVVESFALPDALKSSGDTMTGALKLDGGIKQQTSADLSGTYADHQVMLSDSYSVTGDVTISDNLVLAKISDDSNAVTLTNDTSTRTITGTGSLEASTLVQTPNASLTGMTGTVGSGVTIGSAVTFPTATIRFIDNKEIMSAAGSVASTSWLETDDAGSNPRLSIDIAQSTIDLYSKIIIEASFTMYLNQGSTFTLADVRFVRGDYGASNGSALWGARGSYFGIATPSINPMAPVNIHIIDESLPTSNGAEYYIQFRKHHGNAAYCGAIAPLGAETDIGARITAWGVI